MVIHGSYLPFCSEGGWGSRLFGIPWPAPWNSKGDQFTTICNSLMQFQLYDIITWSTMMRILAKHTAAQDPFGNWTRVRRRHHARNWKKAPFDATMTRRNLVRKYLGKIGLTYGLFQRVHTRRYGFLMFVLHCFVCFRLCWCVLDCFSIYLTRRYETLRYTEMAEPFCRQIIWFQFLDVSRVKHSRKLW